MRRLRSASITLALTLATVACAGRPPRGGPSELQLVAATQAGDVHKVKQLLAGGADPNKLVDVAGSPQSAWFIALRQLRPSRPETSQIALAMLSAGADSRAAWGTNGGRPRESFRETFFSGHRTAGTDAESPVLLAMDHPDAAVIAAIVNAGFDVGDGPRALTEAVDANEAAIVHLLVEHGVNANTPSSVGSPLGVAIASRNVALMTYLEEHGATERGR